MEERDLIELEAFLKKIPAIHGSMGKGFSESGNWWIKFTIDLDHSLAWNVVQELGHILNYISLEDRLPAVFMPVSPPPYLNGGPRDYLSWVIESTSPDFTPASALEFLKGRLPRPVEDEAQWQEPAD